MMSLISGPGESHELTQFDLSIAVEEFGQFDVEGYVPAAIRLRSARSAVRRTRSPRSCCGATEHRAGTAGERPRVESARWAPVAADLRAAARQLSQLGGLRRSGPSGAAVAALVVALVALVAEIALWREPNQQRQQADSARRAAFLLNEDGAAHQSRFAAPG